MTIPESIKRQISDPQPNVEQFVKVVTGRAEPQKVHLAELFADQEIMQWFTENVFEKQWIPAPSDPAESEQMKKHLLCEIEYWHRMGYDYIRVTGGLDFPSHSLDSADTAEMAHDKRSWADGHHGPIQSPESFERYPWPVVKDENLWGYHFVAENLPDGMGMMVCPQSGFLEIPMHALIGYESLALMIHDQPALVRNVFDAVRERIVEVYRRLVDIPQVAGFFQGDDMGFRSGPLFSPDFLKTHSLPGHKELVELAHSRGKIYMLHACGQLDILMDYLIDEIGIDAKHSFEDAIEPIESLFDRYGKRVALLGGVDVDLLGRAEEDTVRLRVRQILDHCAAGRFALGSGNTIANYCLPQNVLAMFDEAFCRNWT